MNVHNRKAINCKNGCPFCGKPIQEGDPRPYIYPIPKCAAFPDGGLPQDGIESCIDCAPRIRELQIKQGLVLIGYNDGAKEISDD